MRAMQNTCLAVLLNLCMLLPLSVLAETVMFNGESYNKEDVDSCREEAGFSGLKGDALIDYIQTCLEDFQGMADYGNMGQEKPVEQEKQNGSK